MVKNSNLPEIKNTFWARGVAGKQFSADFQGIDNQGNPTGVLHDWKTQPKGSKWPSMTRHYLLDSSREFQEYVENFDHTKYKEVHILGNSPCLNKVPDSILNDESIFLIGLNRSYVKCKTDILIFFDLATFQDMADDANNEKQPEKSNLENSMILRAGMGFPSPKARRMKEGGMYNVYTESRHNVIAARHFLKALINHYKGYEALPNLNKMNFLQDKSVCTLFMLLSVCNAALHLVTRLFPSTTPVILDGVSYDVRYYFYKEDTGLNKNMFKKSKNGTSTYGFSKDTNFARMCDNLDMSLGQGIQHREVCYYLVRYLMTKGYNIQYTADSMIFDYMANKFPKISKLEYETI